MKNLSKIKAQKVTKYLQKGTDITFYLDSSYGGQVIYSNYELEMNNLISIHNKITEIKPDATFYLDPGYEFGYYDSVDIHVEFRFKNITMEEIYNFISNESSENA